jgi:hypothetical protein
MKLARILLADDHTITRGFHKPAEPELRSRRLITDGRASASRNQLRPDVIGRYFNAVVECTSRLEGRPWLSCQP